MSCKNDTEYTTPKAALRMKNSVAATGRKKAVCVLSLSVAKKPSTVDVGRQKQGLVLR